MIYGSLARCAFLSCLALALSIAASGCASMTGTANQSVSIQTIEKGGREVSGAQCEMSNGKGKWFITTPGTSMITRSNDDMQVLCSKKGHEPGRASVVSATKGAMFGNIILGGGIGAIIDHNSGAAYEYPSLSQSAPATSATLQPASTSAPSTTRTAGAVSDLQTNRSVEDRLKELKRLHDSGLIDTNVYLEQQRRIMELQ